MIDYRPIAPDDIGKLCRDIRPADKIEAEATHNSVREALEQSIDVSHEAFTTTEYGEPICFAGIALHEMRGQVVGMPWLLGTERVYQNPMALIRTGVKYVDEYEPHVDVMHQMVWEENHPSLKFLSRLDFKPNGVRIVRNGYTFTMLQRGGLCVRRLHG